MKSFFYMLFSHSAFFIWQIIIHIVKATTRPLYKSSKLAQYTKAKKKVCPNAFFCELTHFHISKAYAYKCYLEHLLRIHTFISKFLEFGNYIRAILRISHSKPL